MFGIDIRVHIMFVYLAVILIGIGASRGAGPTTALFLLLLAIFVLLHELGHARVAQHYGIKVVDIVLWPLGGMARMAEIPEKPKVEIMVALAGPAVNFVIAAIAGLTMLAIEFNPWINPLEDEMAGRFGPSFLALILVTNLMLGAFNLIPAFPMDGGRVLRAALASRSDWLKATERAVLVGRYIAYFGLVYWAASAFNDTLPSPGCVLPFICVYLIFEGTRELWMTRLRHGQPFMGSMNMGGGGQGPMGGFGFGGPGAGPGGPEGPQGGPNPGGAMRLEDLFRQAREANARASQSGSEESQDSGPIIEGRTSGGFSEEDIERLEGKHGPIDRPQDD